MSETVLVTLLSTLGSLGVAYLGYLGIRAGVKAAKKRRTEAAPDGDDELIITYEKDPAKFVKDVLADNTSMRDEIRDMREEQTRMWNEVTQLREALENQKREENRFRDALGRWLAEIFAAWGKAQTMPWPRTSDLEILKHVLPER